VELLDLYPTLVDLCGLSPAAGLEGQSLRPWLEEPDLASRAAAFSQFPRPRMDDEPQLMGYAVRTATHRYVEWRRFGTSEVVARELYAYDGDTLLESENVADDPRQSGLIEKMSMIRLRLSR
jgi:iduronate 2-sulfatase